MQAFSHDLSQLVLRFYDGKSCARQHRDHARTRRAANREKPVFVLIISALIKEPHHQSKSSPVVEERAIVSGAPWFDVSWPSSRRLFAQDVSLNLPSA